MSDPQQGLGKCRLTLTGPCVPARFLYTSYGAFLALEATKAAHLLLGLTLANHPSWNIRLKRASVWGLSQA